MRLNKHQHVVLHIDAMNRRLVRNQCCIDAVIDGGGTTNEIEERGTYYFHLHMHDAEANGNNDDNSSINNNEHCMSTSAIMTAALTTYVNELFADYATAASTTSTSTTVNRHCDWTSLLSFFRCANNNKNGDGANSNSNGNVIDEVKQALLNASDNSSKCNHHHHTHA